MCSSCTGQRYIFLIMILPEKSGRCKTDVGRVMTCHLYGFFCYLLMRDRSMGSCLSWADKVLPIEFGGGYYRKEKVAEIQYAIVYVKATVEYEANQ